MTNTTVGQAARDMDEAVAYAVKEWTARLERNDVPPAATRVEGKDTVVFSFWTDFRRRRADELLRGGTKYGGQLVRVRCEVLADAGVGQVNGTPQDTPWTCGPAALRAVLAHHGDDVPEDAVAVLAGNVPVLGVRPSGLVKAATELGYHVSAFQAAGPAALAPLLARDLPVMCVVDSFTQPGKAGHWVVVTAVGPAQVTLMDPHAPGCWRTLTPAEFDARWWHREGGRKARRLAVVVVPQALVAVGARHVSELPDSGWIFDLERLKQAWPLVAGGRASDAARRAALQLAVNLDADPTFRQQADERDAAWVAEIAARAVAVGAEVEVPEPPPAHGRTAVLRYKGLPRWLDVMGKVQRGVTKALVTAFSGGTAARAWDEAQGALMKAAGGLHGKELATWYNNASNEEVAALRLGQLRAMVAKHHGKKDDEARVHARWGLTPELLAAPTRDALRALLRVELGTYGAQPMVPEAMKRHQVQALAILLYGGPDALPLVDALLKQRPRASAYSDKGLDALVAWADGALATLDKAVEPAEPEREFA